MTVKIESTTETVGYFRVVVTRYVDGGPWWVKVFRIGDNAEFSLQRFSYGTAAEGIAVGKAWATEWMANNRAA